MSSGRFADLGWRPPQSRPCLTGCAAAAAFPEHGERWANPSTPAFVGIDRHGHITGGLVPDSVTRAVKRISKRAGVPLHWTGHSLRIGLASTARKRGRDGIAIADQGGWARHSRSMLGYMQREDGWDDNASAGLT
ncbi:hypothetical protein ABZV67_38845 [Streptomyces sp. NPDC005065]|uniref:hypothetical protein n=1 Tax=unclassified Streptomyces TaxID=2593676 RepID=UPI0033B9260F